MKSGKIIIHTDEAYAELGDLYGIFFEDINHAADGGLYGELVQNRSFEFDGVDNQLYHPLTAWEIIKTEGAEGEVYIGRKDPLHKNQPNYAVISHKNAEGELGLRNTGYNTGIPVRKESYRFSCFAKSAENVMLNIALESKDGEVYGCAQIALDSADWKQYETIIEANAEDFSGRLAVTMAGAGCVFIDMISLFPVDTFKGRKNGMRKDLAQLLADMKPKFMRFPGGCLVHDGSLNPEDRDSMYRWKNTIGEVWERPAKRNNWGYNQTLGLGYFEYFQFCEDIGAKPLPVLPGAYDPHHKRIVAIDELQPWIDDALDLIEFANGDETTKWGQVRAQMGHPAPFGLEYLAIGNEEVGEAFFERYPYFHKAIKAKYPEIKLINSASPFAEGAEYERGWQSAREWNSELIDEHYYEAPEWLLANYHRYDNMDPNGPKVFLGEYASLKNSYENALAEAAYMTGLEKNAPVVKLACYAPMFCNADYVNWKPDMIWFDNHRAYGSTSYYTQKMFMVNQGEKELKTEDTFERETPQIPALSGKARIKTDGCCMKLWNICVTNIDTGEQKSYNDIVLGSKNCQILLNDIPWDNYTISFKAKKLEGKKGLIVFFGETENESINWTVGGWQNQDSTLASRYNDEKESCLTQSLFEFLPLRDYEFKLEVKGRQLTTYVDDKVLNDVEYKPLILEPVYYCASVENDEYIVKLVNVTEEELAAEIVLGGMPEGVLTGTAEVLENYAAEIENSFEEPEAVAPVIKEIAGCDGKVAYPVSAKSVHVLRIKMK